MKDPQAQQPGADGVDGGGPTDNPFGDGPAQGPAEEPSGKQFNFFGLRNSEPPLQPKNVGQQLDMAAEWYEHLFTGFLKQSESGGTEAWMHYVVAAVLLADNELGILEDSEREEVSEKADEWDHPGPEGEEP
jgi:hypothetical protein